jgi:hypothetical protein
MEITVSIAGEELESRGAAKQLHLIADMVKAGVTQMDGFSIDFMGTFSMDVDFESDGPAAHHHDYVDGEGNHVHVNAEGVIILRRIAETDEVEQLFEKGIKLPEWAKEHGGVTPYFAPGEGPDDDHKGHSH